MLTKANVAARVRELTEAQFARLTVTTDRIVAELAKIAFGHPTLFEAFPGGLRVYEKLDALKTLAKLQGVDGDDTPEMKAAAIYAAIKELDEASFVDPPNE